jgi:outer membrane protein OmpA-like peptidoglycan-associated protein/opacity protein-like surface antigen
LATVAYAQTANNPPNKAGGGNIDEHPDLVEIDPFGGISIYTQVNSGLDEKLVDGGVFGIRAAWNASRWVGIEGFVAWANAPVEFKTSPGIATTSAGTVVGVPAGAVIPPYSFNAHNWLWGLGPVFNLRPRGSRFQPYATAGVAGVQFTPSKGSRALAVQPPVNALYHTANLNDNLQAAVYFGVGAKYHLTDHFGLRFDAREFWSRNPTYDLPNYPDGGVYIPAKQKIWGFEGTLGLVFYLGQTKCPEMPAPPPPPPPLPTPTISGGQGTICIGTPVTMHATMSGAPSGHNLTYAWTLNGQAQVTNSADFSFTPNNAGTFNVQVTVTDTTAPPPPMERPAKFPLRCWVQPSAPPPVAPVTASASVTVSESTPSISSVTATPNSLSCSANTTGTHTASLSVQASSSACGGNLTYHWTVSEGTLTNETTANPTLDVSGVNFEAGAQAQSKSITATVTVTDQNGKTATQTTTVSVNCQPQFTRLDDVIFAKNNARVNNCGKDILIDQAAKQAGDQYDIVLVGHRDTDEEANAPMARSRRGRRRANETAVSGVPLDEQRVLNAAAVLSGGTGTCANIDPARIKVDWVGTDQTSDTRPGLCGTSNLKERKGSETSAADKNRRVEVYLVPHNSQTMPPAVKNVKPLPADQVRALGCPK